MKVSIFDIGRISSMVANIIDSAWIIIEKGLREGIEFLIIVFIFISLFWYLECCWIEYKDRNGIFE